MQSVIIFVATIRLFTVSQIHAQMHACNNTEVYAVAPEEETNSVSFECQCDVLSTSCLWSPFADRGNILSRGTSETLLMWNRDVGYGHYICLASVGDNFTVVKNVLILPEGKEIKTTRCA